MKRLFLMLAVAMCILSQSTLSASADKVVTRVNIPMKIGPGPRFGRSLTDAPVDAVYWGQTYTLQLTCLSDLGESVLVVTNLTTGEEWDCCFNPSEMPVVFLPLSGTSGNYVIELTTGSGDTYEGEFIIE